MLRLTAFALLAGLSVTGAACAEAGDGIKLLDQQGSDRRQGDDERPSSSGEPRLAPIAMVRDTRQPTRTLRRLDFSVPWQTGVYQ
jgi:hypothetical protein